MSPSPRTHTHITFADPFLRCNKCRHWVTAWHDQDQCGCSSGDWNMPCGHRTGVSSDCPSWGPVNGCRCAEYWGFVPHPPADEPQPEAADG